LGLIRTASLACLLAAIAVAGTACTSPPPASAASPQPQTTGRMLAQAACPVRIISADAWVDRMPGASRQTGQVHVTARLEKPGDTAILLRSGLTTRETLYLEVRSAAASVRPGELDYREDAPDPVFRRVVFLCRGGDVFSLDAVRVVF
jgi:hypothetical protein